LASTLLISKMTAANLWTFRISWIKNFVISVCVAWTYAICYAWCSLKYSFVMCNFKFFFCWIGESELVNDLCALLSVAWSFWTVFAIASYPWLQPHCKKFCNHTCFLGVAKTCVTRFGNHIFFIFCYRILKKLQSDSVFIQKFCNYM
jgi:hypothetical protein